LGVGAGPQELRPEGLGHGRFGDRGHADDVGPTLDPESARGVVATRRGPTYLTWQGCRDRMEYILRPRFL